VRSQGRGNILGTGSTARIPGAAGAPLTLEMIRPVVDMKVQ
jgi:hypothetical protein